MFDCLQKRGSYMVMVSSAPPLLRLPLINSGPWSAAQTKVLLKTLPQVREISISARQGTMTGLEVADESTELVDYAVMQQGLTAADKSATAYVYVLRKDQYSDGRMSIKA